MESNRFNVRVYGLLLNEKEEILVTDEFRLGVLMMKFPGGGLEFGEGTIDCLRRECMEDSILPGSRHYGNVFERSGRHIVSFTCRQPSIVRHGINGLWHTRDRL